MIAPHSSPEFFEASGCYPGVDRWQPKTYSKTIHPVRNQGSDSGKDGDGALRSPGVAIGVF
jgi:hypothetical protein